MLCRKQVLVVTLITVWVVAAEGRFVRQKRQMPEEMAQTAIESAMNMMNVMKESIGSGAGAAPNGDVSIPGTGDMRRKRHTEPEAEELDPDMQEVQSIWRDMWETMVHGAKKIVKKIADKFQREDEQQQAQSEFYN